MSINYVAYTFSVSPKEPATEILIAQLGFAGFESFVEHSNGVTAYIPEGDWNSSILEDIQILNTKEFKITYKKELIAPSNWNREWEKNFNPLQVDGLVSIRAPFHKDPNLEFDIIIEPKMSFGTGHHETTRMMIQHLISLDLTDKKVLDMGSGTGILAIFAEMKGADKIEAIDIDSWSYQNSLENVERNNCKRIDVYEGDASLLEHKKYDLIIANINRNILLRDMNIYVDSLYPDGILLLSGFYREDISVIDEEAARYDLKMDRIIESNNWVALKYLK